MKGMAGRIGAWMSAVAFAEVGEHEMALQMLGKEIPRQKSPSWDNLMVAITFAEAGLHGVAREYLEASGPRSTLEALKVPGVRVWYGTATVNP